MTGQPSFSMSLERGRPEQQIGVEILQRIHKSTLISIALVIWKRVSTAEHLLLSRKGVKNGLVQIMNIIITAAKNGAIGKIVILREWSIGMNAWIDGVDKRFGSILWTLEV